MLIPGVWGSAITLEDINGDGSLDLALSGSNMFGDNITEILMNDGDGNFTPVEDLPFMRVWSGNIAFSDIDGGGDADFFMTGQTNDALLLTAMFLHDGTGSFAEVADTIITNVWAGTTIFADFDTQIEQDKCYE